MGIMLIRQMCLVCCKQCLHKPRMFQLLTLPCQHEAGRKEASPQHGALHAEGSAHAGVSRPGLGQVIPASPIQYWFSGIRNNC